LAVMSMSGSTRSTAAAMSGTTRSTERTVSVSAPAHSSMSSTSLPVMLGNKAHLPPGDIQKRPDEVRKPAKRQDTQRLPSAHFKANAHPADDESVFGQVRIALHLTRGIDHADQRTKDSYYIVGNRQVAESLNAAWLSKKQLMMLCKDIDKLGEKLHLFEDEPYALCSTEKYIPCFMFFITCVIAAATVAVTVSEQYYVQAVLMVAGGTMLSITLMCFFCLTFRRRRILDWEVPHKALNHFAHEWGAKHGLRLRFEFRHQGPSFFVLSPKNLEDYLMKPDDENVSAGEDLEDPCSPSAPKLMCKHEERKEWFQPYFSEPP